MKNMVKPGSEVNLEVEGMDCQSCAITIEKFLEKKGNSNISVNYASGDVSFELGDQTEFPQLVQGLEKLGYKVARNKADQHDHDHHHNMESGNDGIQWELLISLVFTIPLLTAMFLDLGYLRNPYFQLLLSLPVYFIGFYHFGRNAFNALRNGVIHMDLLIFTGAAAAFVYSIVGSIILENGRDYMFFETGATIITLVLIGNYIERRSVKATSSAIKELGRLQPTKAKLVTYASDGKEQYQEVEYHQIRKGDFLKANNGDRIATDGEIVEGTASINEAMVTGESVPVNKSKGDNVIGGTVLVEGSIKMKVSATGDDTALAHIIDLVRKAQSNKPAIQKFADRVSGIFVPVVLLISLATFLLSYFVFGVAGQNSLLHSIAVLVIACPCAMGLATPTAIMVGIGRVSKAGILIKGGSTIETFAHVKSIVFDKTGTLTTGEFKIQNINAIDFNPEELKSILVGLESHSSHPIALSVSKELRNSPALTMKNIVETKGLSIEGNDANDNKYVAGGYGIATQLTKEEGHNIYVLKNGALIGTIDIMDEIKPEAQAVIEELKRMKIRTIMLSGDNLPNCERVAHAVGIDEFHAKQSPKTKIEFIERISREAVTAMVGDGINDAPALAQATIGVSMSNASQIAIQSSQVILLNGDLSLLTKALHITAKTLQTIRQNLFWALSYNLVAIPIAAFGLLNPMWGAAFMAFSDLVVIGNSIRLKTRRIS